MKLDPKPVYIGNHHVGEATTWDGVVCALSDAGFRIPGNDHASHHGFETPDGFFMSATTLRRAS